MSRDPRISAAKAPVALSSCERAEPRSLLNRIASILRACPRRGVGSMPGRLWCAIGSSTNGNGGRCGHARRFCRAVATLILGIAAQSVLAQVPEKMDQFHVVAIPTGIAKLEPAEPTQGTRDIVFKPQLISSDRLLTFARAICRNEQASIQTFEPTWFQWFRGAVPAQAIC